jgi:23S rRNA (cytosine1962-C5)-methyltransferase
MADLEQQRVRRLLEAALVRRTGLGALEATRLFDGAGDGITGLSIDKLGVTAVVRIHEGTPADFPPVLSAMLESLPRLSGCTGAVLWRHGGDAVDTTRDGAKQFFGVVPEEYTMMEHGLAYLIRPYATPSAGFFIDMREVRAQLLQTSQGKRVLNTFCFTGSLGIAAWCGGAAEVVQVDISKSILSWARKNVELQGSAGSGAIRYIPEDTKTFLEREVRRVERGKERYDTIIIDPPVFGSSKGVRFIQQDDLEEVVLLAVRLLQGSGELYLTSNFSGATPETLLAVAIRVLRGMGRDIATSRVLTPPPIDFPTQQAASRAMRGVSIRLLAQP